MKKNKSMLKILELFAGVGGFRVGLENSDPNYFKTLWSNQFEPMRVSQDAFDVYDYHYPDSENLNIDIGKITDKQFSAMDADLIVGGFPCQDYSVARSKKNELGIEGKKGVLFWEIIRATKIIKPEYLILENVDRLLKAPSKQRGRDFAIMLSAFNSLGYSLEWRIINAADYGRSQKRSRVYIFVFRNDSKYFKNCKVFKRLNEEDSKSVIHANSQLKEDGLFAKQFPVKPDTNKNRISYGNLSEDIVQVSNNFTGSFWNSGIMTHGKFVSLDTTPNYSGKKLTLRDILLDEERIPDRFYVSEKEKIEKFKYLRGPKKIERTSSEGFKYMFSEGGMSETDDLDLPGRTMLTSEGTINRSTHFIKVGNKYRLLTPIEAERLQDFPDDWTRFKITSSGEVVEVSDKMRMFFMGNALVTEIVKLIGDYLKDLK
ncbi:DNA (cytosine-5-)-methyltransferase [Taylorella equigenitalis]|uniref:DNA (cytosine-5-)-methyltransferase n=1 Tax=Taylorella equigenitalis TaxID=29575 RepID=UPI00237C9D59|nr:DNA (cytosine-5-)-methyltransferase [Taylorella equigenitalis]WDU52842.1 DNA (cytosine-5-)-methyltransferase [Taylorella equigenitalis]